MPQFLNIVFKTSHCLYWRYPVKDLCLSNLYHLQWFLYTQGTRLLHWIAPMLVWEVHFIALHSNLQLGKECFRHHLVRHREVALLDDIKHNWNWELLEFSGATANSCLWLLWLWILISAVTWDNCYPSHFQDSLWRTVASKCLFSIDCKGALSILSVYASQSMPYYFNFLQSYRNYRSLAAICPRRLPQTRFKRRLFSW